MTLAKSAEEWAAEGRLLDLGIRGDQFGVFLHDSGSGPSVTMLHGFPTSSFEWSGVSGRIERSHRVLAPDFLGFGQSDKPDVDYSIGLQADLIEAMWDSLGIEGGTLLGYDYGGMVVMELLARQREGKRSFTPERVVLLNSAIFSYTYRPRRLTRLMASGPLSGLLGKAMNEKTVTRSWSEVFSPDHPLDPAVAATHWRLLDRDGSRRALRRMLHFVPERSANANRWDDALTEVDIPLHLIWGVEDLVSGSDAALVPTQLPAANLEAMSGVGHAPHMEVPTETAEAIARAIGA